MAKNEEKQKTRPDLDDERYLAWLSLQTENRGIDINGLYRSMLDWCGKRRVTPTRRRLLRWLDGEREAVPMTAAPLGMRPSEAESAYVPPEPCEICGQEICFKLHREERGI